MRNIQIGTRSLQFMQGAFSMNIPMIAARTLGLQARDRMCVSITPDGALLIEKEESAHPDLNLAGSSQGAPQQTQKKGVVADAISG